MQNNKRTSFTDISLAKTWHVITLSDEEQFIQIFKQTFADKSITPPNKCSYINSLEQLKNIRKDNQKFFLNIELSQKFLDRADNLAQILTKLKLTHYSHIVLWVKQSFISDIFSKNPELAVFDIRFVENLNHPYLKVLYNNINQNFLNSFRSLLQSDGQDELVQKLEQLSDFNIKLRQEVDEATKAQKSIFQDWVDIEKQKCEIEYRNQELERAFKKSSINHIKLQKAFRENEEQRIKLEELLLELQEKNRTLENQFEEITNQRNFIEQQNEEIQTQRDMALKQRDKILEQQEEINDNIQYASRIQHALFPQKELMEQLLPRHFVLNKPKDIVSGDFFWISQNRQKTVVAVADCTGHGISGAMMSMLGTAFLNEIINKNDITHSELILDQLRERVISSLHQDIQNNIEYSRDGMDISVCIIDIIDYTLEYSGANNPIYIIRNKELIELKADKIPIGIHEFWNEPFTSQKIDLIPGDTIYMFSDGFADQFGGKNGKKLKYKNFKEILLGLDSVAIEERSIILNQKFEDWKGFNDQIDDVLVLGFTIV